jgi:predicted PurR-regulated permease PerM
MFLLMITNIDTILRPRLVPKGAYLNPALVILSVLGGLQLMGLIGALYGPVIMILLVTSIDVYTKYMLRSILYPFLMN